MAENNNDLEAFFQKKAKKHKKRGGVQDLDAIGKRLDRNVRKQEELDKEEEERLQRSREQEQAQVGNEDSEWHDVVARDVDLAAAGVKDMDLGEQEDEFDIQEEDSAEKVKGWGVVDGEAKTETNDTVQQVPVDTAPKKYVPPSRLRAATAHKGMVAPKLGDQEEFPSLGAAEEIEKVQEQARKKHEHFQITSGGTRPTESQKENEADGFQLYHSGRNAAPTSTDDPPKPNRYIPPHLRNKSLAQHQEQHENRFHSLQQE